MSVATCSPVVSDHAITTMHHFNTMITKKTSITRDLSEVLLKVKDVFYDSTILADNGKT